MSILKNAWRNISGQAAREKNEAETTAARRDALIKKWDAAERKNAELMQGYRPSKPKR